MSQAEFLKVATDFLSGTRLTLDSSYRVMIHVIDEPDPGATWHVSTSTFNNRLTVSARKDKTSIEHTAEIHWLEDKIDRLDDGTIKLQDGATGTLVYKEARDLLI